MYKLLSEVEVDQQVRNDIYQEYFSRICREIIGQQLSGKVAKVIVERFHKLCETEKPSAENVLQLDDQKLRDVGMAWSKVRAIKDLATKTISGELKISEYTNMKEDKIMENLLQVKGIGPWTVEMLLIFTLGRSDVFSIKDLGLKKAMCNIYKLDIKEKGVEKKLLPISEKWKPYRTYASLALWKSLDLEGWWRGETNSKF